MWSIVIAIFFFFKQKTAYEIGERADERRFHLHGRGVVESAVIGGEQVLGERETSRQPLHLAPEFAAYALLVAHAAIVHAALSPIRGTLERHRLLQSADRR